MIEISDSNIETILSSDKPVVIDFYTTWCGPCRAAAPKYKEWSEKHGEKAIFAKCDTDDAFEFATTMAITGVPTFIVFKDGKESKRFVGMPKESDLLEAIK